MFYVFNYESGLIESLQPFQRSGKRPKKNIQIFKFKVSQTHSATQEHSIICWQFGSLIKCHDFKMDYWKCTKKTQFSLFQKCVTDLGIHKRRAELFPRYLTRNNLRAQYKKTARSQVAHHLTASTSASRRVLSLLSRCVANVFCECGDGEVVGRVAQSKGVARRNEG